MPIGSTVIDSSNVRPSSPSEHFVENSGIITLRYNSKIHHIGIGRTLKGTRVKLLIHNQHIRIIHDTTGELLRDFTLDKTRNYQPQKTENPLPKEEEI